jgi:predicted DNA-binding transcriptional regulator AlpA
MTEPITLSLEQAAQFLNISPKTLYNLTRKQSQTRHPMPVPFLRIARKVAFRRDSLLAWVHKLETAAQEK